MENLSEMRGGVIYSLVRCLRRSMPHKSRETKNTNSRYQIFFH